jgi:hypothetical protein
VIDLKILNLFGLGGIHFHWHATAKKQQDQVEVNAAKELARITRAAAKMREFEAALWAPNGTHKDLAGKTVLVMRDEDGRGEWYAFVFTCFGVRPRFHWKPTPLGEPLRDVREVIATG